ncbi:hypothetical protein [Alistipes sp.]|uniref:UGSC family (seleno)protein n=1 Tax=Alistipes sp. TaxID=1872444 RepID=UPI003AF13405
MKKFSLFVWSLLAAVAASAQVAQPAACDEVCLLEAGVGDPAAAGTYAVVSPVGRPTVGMIAQAPRLESLDHKTIAVVGGSFMASVTHPEIKRLILENYPTARVLLLSEIGSAGVYPAPGVTRRAKEEFQRRLREMGVDAVIAGNGGCGLCTPKETGSSIAAEYLGIPAVTIAATGFAEQVYATALNNGVPAPRVAVYPGAFAAHTREELLENTRNVLWPQIVDALTRPLTEQEIARAPAQGEAAGREVVFAGTLDEVNRFFTGQRWSDGLPIVPPTRERVEEFLRFTDRPWDQTVGVLPVAHRNTLVWHVAVNGVMAGCPPEFMPLLLAFTEALGDPVFRRSLGSTHGWIPYCWINGPVARQLGIDCGQGAISEPRNAALGRFMNLAMMNLAGYYVKEDRMGTFGYPMPWCLAEDEAACLGIGWEPWHVAEGYGLNDNTLTAASALLWGNNLTPATADGERIMELMAWDITRCGQFALGSGKPFTDRTILVTASVARDLARTYPTREELEGALVAAARQPAAERAAANYWANPGSAFDPGKYSVEQHLQRIIRQEGGERTDAPAWSPTEGKIWTVPVMKPGMTPILVTGDPDRNKVQTMPGGGRATRAIELPAAWDALMAERGYRPLSEFFL